MTSLFLTLLQLPFYFLQLLEVIYFITRCRPKKQIRNEHVLITGASRGTGAKLAQKLAELGNTVHLVGRDKALIEQNVEEIRSQGRNAHAHICDLSQSDQVVKLHKDMSSAGHDITVLIMNARVEYGVSIGDLTLDQLDSSVKANLTSNMWLVKLFLPKMVELGKGHVITMSSALALFTTTRVTDYCATKAGQAHMTRQLRAELINSDTVKFTNVYCTRIEPDLGAAVCLRGILENKTDIVLVKSSIAAFGLRVYGWLPQPLRKFLSMRTVDSLKQ